MNIIKRTFVVGSALCAGMLLFFAFRAAPAGHVYRIITSVEMTGADASRLVIEGSGDDQVSRELMPMVTGLGKFGKHVGSNDRTIEQAINELTAAGWELTGTSATSISPAPMPHSGVLTSGAIVTRYIFRRPM